MFYIYIIGNNIISEKNYNSNRAEYLIKEFKEKGLVYVPRDVIGKISSNSLMLLTNMFYSKYLKTEINLNQKNKKQYHCIDTLIRDGFLKTTKQDVYKAKDLIISKHKIQYKEKNETINKNHCEWCNIETFMIHKHHFPVARSMGGVDIVNICPNCHYSFHSMVDNNELEITDKTINAFLNL